MIIVKGNSLMEVVAKLSPLLRNKCEIELHENTDEFTLILPERCKGKNIMLIYRDKRYEDPTRYESFHK